MPNPTKRTRRKHRNRTHSFRGRSAEKIDLGELTDLIGYTLRRAQIVFFRDFLKTFAKFHIRPIQYGVLTVIDQNPGLKQSHVCSALGIKRANFVTLLDTLERRALIKREPAVNDQRANALYLTTSGKVLMRKLRVTIKAHEKRVAARLNKVDRRRLIRLLHDVISAADPSL
jgi:DNA-binding MarR family transcriptional regulator